MSTTAEPKIKAEVGQSLTEAQAREIYRQGEEAVVFFMLQQQARLFAQSQQMLAQSRQLAESQMSTAVQGVSAASLKANVISPTVPSGMQPVYTKASVPKRRKRPGRKAGHQGVRRERPERIDRVKEHRLASCPECHGQLRRCDRIRRRYTEDIPQDIKPQVTEHVIHRDWCPKCRRFVEPVVPEAMSGCTLGHRVVALSAWLHYGLGQSISQIVEVFNHHLQLQVSPGGLVQMWRRLAEQLAGWYEQIHADALRSAVLHADETGWRVNGKTHWLWCFSTNQETLYMIHKGRGGPALRKFFREEFAGTLVCDFWSAYNAVVSSRKQRCLVHLLRDLDYVETYRKLGQDWEAFAKLLRRLLGDAIRLWKRDGVDEREYASRRQRIAERLSSLVERSWEHVEVRRLCKRLRRHQDELFVFLDHDGVSFENNHAERAIRPAVIIRKNSQSNRSDRGAVTQTTLMSVYRTLKQRGCEPLDTLVQSLRSHLTAGVFPPLPQKSATNG